MPHVPHGVSANVLYNFGSPLVSWMDGSEIPKHGPHTVVPQQWGCTINQDFYVDATRSNFKKGMQGHLIGLKENGNVKIFIRGVTEYWHKSNWIENQWVPANNVDKGKRWKSNIKDWDFKMQMSEWKLGSPESVLKATRFETTVLSKTITGLINEFHTNPAPFMGTKIQDLLDKRATQNKGSNIESITKTIIQGIKDANLFTILNNPDFTVTDIISTASYTIDRALSRGAGCGIYIRYHTSSSTVTRWQPNTKYIYVGKTTDFKDRYDNHPSSKSSYGDLTRNSHQLLSCALCVMSEKDVIDFAYLVEQIFVCLLESYRANLLVELDSVVVAASDIEYIEALQAAHYFRQVSEKVFKETNFPGAINRLSFGVSNGANYSMPFKEWAVAMEQMLFLRYDTAIKAKSNGQTVPITVFRRAKSKIANYTPKSSGSNPNAYEELCAFQKYSMGKCFFSVRHTQNVRDGTMGPRQDDPYQLVFEVRTDGQAHPYAWSRLYDIGPYENWAEGRALAARIEWEYPSKSGMWRHRYLYCHTPYNFHDKNIAGSHIGYFKTIPMIQWLFDAAPNKPQPWMPRLRGCAYVLQTVYNYHTQTVEVRPQKAFTMRSGALKSKNSLIVAMNALGLDNVNGPFIQNKVCDTCAMLSTKALNVLGSKCGQVPGQNYCRNCILYGRPCCSWTKNGAVRGMRAFSEGMIAGQSTNEGKVTSDDVALNKKYRAALHFQILPKEEEQTKPFRQQLIDVVSLAMLEDDLSDAEDAEEQFEGEEAYAED